MNAGFRAVGLPSASHRKTMPGAGDSIVYRIVPYIISEYVMVCSSVL